MKDSKVKKTAVKKTTEKDGKVVKTTSENESTITSKEEEGIKLKTDSFSGLENLKEELQKKEYQERVPLTTEQILDKTLHRMEKLQRQNDVVMREIFNTVEDSEVSNIRPIVLKVFRGKKLYFTTAETKFRFANKIFYICSHKEAIGEGVIQFIESLDVLSATNSVLRLHKRP